MLQVVDSMIHLHSNIEVLSIDVERFERYFRPADWVLVDRSAAKMNEFVQFFREKLLSSHPTLRLVVLTRSPSTFEILLSQGPR